MERLKSQLHRGIVWYGINFDDDRVKFVLSLGHSLCAATCWSMLKRNVTLRRLLFFAFERNDSCGTCSLGLVPAGVIQSSCAVTSHLLTASATVVPTEWCMHHCLYEARTLFDLDNKS